MSTRLPGRAAVVIALGLLLSTVSLRAQDPAGDLEREVAPRSGMPCPPPGSYSPTRPHPAGTPTVVGLRIIFQDIAQVSDVDQTLDGDVYVVTRWRDPRLADSGRGMASAECPVPEGALWIPALEPENIRNRQSFYAPRFLVDARGVVTLIQRLWVKVADPLDLHDFPFDRHRWTVTLWPAVETAEDLVFRPLPLTTAMNDRLTIQGWRVGRPKAEAGTAPRLARAGVFARFDVSFDLERNWAYYAWKLGLPLVLVVLMAYGVYFIPASGVSQQVGLSTTSMLTLIAYMLALESGLPRISYLTRADRFFVGSAVLVFVGLAKAIVTSALGDQDGAVVARLNRWGRWIYPFGMLANFLFAVFL